MKPLYKIIFLQAALLLIWSSCKVESVKLVTETTKSIAGSWKVVKATRNGTDITTFPGLDFSQFRVNFNTDNSYTLVNPLPFIVNQSGTYSLNDPQVPTQITFNATGGQPLTTNFSYPIVTGVRNINLQFTANPGCNDNTYIYTLQKVN